MVTFGTSIEATVDAAEPGDFIHISPGVYAEHAIVVRRRPAAQRPGAVVIENPDTIHDVITATDGGDRFTLGFGRRGW